MQSSIGNQLAGARRARGLSILDVSHKTRISATIIRSIEADNFANCPSLVYAKGFVKQLDHFLDTGLDQEIADFDTGPAVTTPEVLITVPGQRWSDPTPAAPPAGETRHTFIGLAVGILLIATLPVAAIKWYQSSQRKNTTLNPPQPVPPMATEPAAPTTPRAKELITTRHIPHGAPPELEAIARFENNVDLDELSPPALPANQPLPPIYSSPAIASNKPQTNPVISNQKPKPAAPESNPPTSDKKKSFFSRFFRSNRR